MSSSIFDSVNSAIDRFTQAYNIEPKKYERKGIIFSTYLGIGKYVGYVFLVSYFTLLPKLFESVLPYFLDTLPCKYLLMNKKNW